MDVDALGDSQLRQGSWGVYAYVFLKFVNAVEAGLYTGQLRFGGPLVRTRTSSSSAAGEAARDGAADAMEGARRGGILATKRN